MLSIQLFGDFSVLDGDRPAAMDSRRARALLAYLLLHRAAPVPRARLAAVFWPDTTDAQARANLRHVIHELRAALPHADLYLRIERQTLGWNPDAPCRLDVAAFEAAARGGDADSLRAAADLYRDDLLPDWPDEWLAPERERLARLYDDALARLADRLEAAGEYAEAAAVAARPARRDPAREAHAVRLMRLLALSGDRVGVHRAYSALETALRAEVGLAPSAETRAERDRLLAHRPETVAASHGRPAPRLIRPPAPPDPLIGREADLARVMALLARRRLVTLIGFGGVGKTRLALAAAVGVAPDFPDGVAWAELTPLDRGEPVAGAVAAALGVAVPEDRPIEEALVDAVGDRRLLLALDNCEHVTAGVVDLAGRLLRHCPALVVLATSRSRLRLPGETLYPVPPLGIPAPGDPTGETGDAASVRLFAARAAVARPSFRLSAENAAVVADICRRLEGIPLAIELAAARARHLSAAAIAARLDETTHPGPPARPGRGDTLWAALDWSYDLLPPGERAVLRRLSLFAASFDLEAAEGIAGDEEGPVRRADVLGLLSNLIDHSLVVSEEAPDRYRYRLHAATRDYAAARLAEAGERDAAMTRYAAHYLALVEAPAASPEARWAALSAERPNLPAATAWAREREQWELVGRLSVGLGEFWAITGDHRRGREWLAETLRHEADLSPRLRAEARRALGTLEFEAGRTARAAELYVLALDAFRALGDAAAVADVLGRLGHAAQLQGDYETAATRYRDSLALYRDLDDARGAALLTNRLAHVAYYRGELDEARALLERALATRQALDDRRGMASTLNGLGEVARAAGRLAEAAELYERALALCREMGDRRCIAGIEHNLGHVALARGRPDEARARFAAALAVYGELEHRGGIALCLYGLAGAAGAGNRAADAARLMGAADALAEAAGLVHGPADGEALEEQRGALRAALGAAGFDAAAAEGRAMGWESVAALA